MSPLDCKEIQPVHSKGDQSWVFFGRTEAKAETPVLWPPHAESWLIGKDSDAGRAWGQEEKGTTEDEMAGWHHRLDGREFGWTPGVGEGQGGLACCGSQGGRELEAPECLHLAEPWPPHAPLGAWFTAKPTPIWHSRPLSPLQSFSTEKAKINYRKVSPVFPTERGGQETLIFSKRLQSQLSSLLSSLIRDRWGGRVTSPPSLLLPGMQVCLLWKPS